MDIVVTVPKSELKTLKKEDEYLQSGEGGIQFWSIGRKPKNLQVGDKVYFVENGAIRYYHIFKGYAESPQCEVTGRVWTGLNLVLEYPEVELEPVSLRGFQGFRYIDKYVKQFLGLSD